MAQLRISQEIQALRTAVGKKKATVIEKSFSQNPEATTKPRSGSVTISSQPNKM